MQTDKVRRENVGGTKRILAEAIETPFQVVRLVCAIAPFPTMHDLVPDMAGVILYCCDFLHTRGRLV